MVRTSGEATRDPGSMDSFDAFMDYNIGLMATSLTPYTSALEADGVSYLLQSFDLGETWYSATMLVPGTHMVVEIFSTSYEGSKTPLASAPRLGQHAAQIALNGTTALNGTETTMSAIRVSRATTDLDAVDTFYSEVFRVSPVIETSDRHCFQLTQGDITYACYTNHSEDESDVLSVAEFEAGIQGVHEAMLDGHPMCGLVRSFFRVLLSSIFGRRTSGSTIILLTTALITAIRHSAILSSRCSTEAPTPTFARKMVTITTCTTSLILRAGGYNSTFNFPTTRLPANRPRGYSAKSPRASWVSVTRPLPRR